MLRALRAVDQLIIREKDPRIFIEETCKVLVEYRGYSGAFIILTHEAGTPHTFSEASGGGQFHPLAENLRLGILPSCCGDARTREGALHVAARSSLCAECPMGSSHMQCHSMCICLRHGETCYGYLMVLVDRDQAVDKEEEALFCDMARDVAFALHTLAQKETMQRMQGERDQMEAELHHAQKMEAVGRLAGGVAHDFNNMLGVILGFTDIALSRLNTYDPLHNNLQQIRKAALRSADLTRQLLAFSRKQVIAPQIVNLNEVIEDHRKMLCRLIGEDIKLGFAPDAELWNVRMDPSQIDQILANLAVNARDAITGVGAVTVETANITLDGPAGQSHQLPSGDYVQLTFSDTGSGMDADTAERIFEPFFTTKGEGKGTGLGLSTVYGIIKQNAGAINVTSAPGEGTTFRIHLPRFEGKPAEQAAKPVEGPLEGTETVLIVEDEGQILFLAKTILENYGYTVLTAATPGDACLVCEKYPGDIHLLLSDVVMPMMNGKELQARIERIKPSIRTLFMSGYTTDDIAGRGIIDRGVNFIPKPFTPDALVGKVRAVLNMRQAPRSGSG